MEKYLRLNIPAAARLQTLRLNATATNKPSWREARTVTFRTLEPFFAHGRDNVGGVRGEVDVYSTFTNPEYAGWRIVHADEVEHSGVDHTGWFQDDEQMHGTIRGFVVRLGGGRFLPGYVNNDNGEWVVYPESFQCIKLAACYADRLAQDLAQTECANNQRYDEAARMQARIDVIKRRLSELQVLIDSRQFDGAGYESEAERITDEAARLTDKLNDEYSDVL